MEFNGNYTWTEENTTLEEDYEKTIDTKAGDVLSQVF